MTPSDAAVLLVDITGSTPLYESIGDAAALLRIGSCLDQLRAIADEAGGMVVRSKGDDLLCAFDDPAAALRAVQAMLSLTFEGTLKIHAGLHLGPVIHARDDIFGDAVNMTARLAALANPGEVLISESFVGKLADGDIARLRALDKVSLRGKTVPIKVYSLQEEDREAATAFGPGTAYTHTRGAAGVAMTLTYAEQVLVYKDTARVSIGRSTECDILIARPWVSRHHATVTLHGGRVQIEDRSSSGTYVAASDGHEFFVRRETVVLTGSGRISPAIKITDARAEIVRFDIGHG